MTGGLGCATSTDGVTWTKIAGNAANGACRDTPAEVSVLLRIPGAEVPDLTLYNPFLPESAGLVIARGRGRLQGVLQLSSRPPPEPDEAPGELHVEATGLLLELGEAALEGDLDLHLAVRQQDLEGRTFGVGGSRLELRPAVFHPPAEEAAGAGKPWWLWLEVPEGSVEVREPLIAQGHFRAGMQDSSPLVALAAYRSSAVHWLRRLLEIRDLEASGRLAVEERGVRLRRLAVDGERLAIRSDLAFAQRRARGAMYLRYGFLDVAVGLGPEGRDWNVWRPIRFYEEQTGEPLDLDPTDRAPSSP